MATLGHRMNLATNKTVSCWMVQHNGSGLLDGIFTYYILHREKDDETKWKRLKTRLLLKLWKR